MQADPIPRLGVNIDHVATLRQARRTFEPDPVRAAAEAELGGADGITLHLREDRRHIQDRDLRLLRETVAVKLNLEMAATDEMVGIAAEVHPAQATLVPEKREEITTEGGLDVAGDAARISDVTGRLKQAGIEVSLFIDPNECQVAAAVQTGADAIELHTGVYANAATDNDRQRAYEELVIAGQSACQAGLLLHMGHGLTYQNVVPVARIEGVQELNIGHSIIARAVFVGLRTAVQQMKALIVNGIFYTRHE